ncbi:MAG: sugar transferase [Clostridiales bacterium]|nr:sugar transferase [Clostridiales bacterium]
MDYTTNTAINVNVRSIHISSEVVDIKNSDNAIIKGVKINVESKPVYEFFKRAFDIVASLLGIIVLSPLLLVIALIIKFSDKGPVFFVQNRTGKDGKVFKMYKFRSMYVDAEKRRNELLDQNEADGPLFKIAKDPRVTKIGAFIRKTSIDELPQLFNCLIGNMSVVGPRPLVTYEQDQCTEYQAQRLLVKPGITCYWQISGRSDLNFDDLIELDLKYIKERSFLTDIKIIFKTFSAVLKSKGAY